MYRYVWAILLLTGFGFESAAQPVFIQVKVFDHGENASDSDLNREFGQSLRTALKLKGAREDGPGMVLYAKASSSNIAAEEYVLVSIIEGAPLRKATVEAGAKHEIWYAGEPEAANPDDASFVRRYMTREILSQLVTIADIRILAFPRSQMSHEISRFIDEMFLRHSCQVNDVCGDR